jgi:putative ubiquitin-RnfH superfamily antitoxin RatB of RatAB toxin-antitoxin module
MEVSHSDQHLINIEVAYALPHKQQIIALQVAEGCTVFEAVEQSNIAKQFPGLDIKNSKMGFFGKAISKPEDEVIKEGDRIEIYRPLLADPKVVRKERAARIKAEKEQVKK